MPPKRTTQPPEQKQETTPAPAKSNQQTLNQTAFTVKKKEFETKMPAKQEDKPVLKNFQQKGLKNARECSADSNDDMQQKAKLVAESMKNATKQGPNQQRDTSGNKRNFNAANSNSNLSAVNANNAKLQRPAIITMEEAPKKSKHSVKQFKKETQTPTKIDQDQEMLVPLEVKNKSKHTLIAEGMIKHSEDSFLKYLYKDGPNDQQVLDWESFQTPLGIKPQPEFTQQLINQINDEVFAPSLNSAQELIIDTTRPAVYDSPVKPLEWYMLHQEEERRVGFQKPFLKEYQTRNFVLGENSEEEMKQDQMLQDMVLQEADNQNLFEKYTETSKKNQKILQDKVNAFLEEYGCPFVDFEQPLKSPNGTIWTPYFVPDIKKEFIISGKNHKFAFLNPVSSGSLDFCDANEIYDVRKSLQKIKDGIYHIMGNLALGKIGPLSFINNPNHQNMTLLYNKVRLGIQLTDICQPHYETNFLTSCNNSIPIKNTRSRGAMDQNLANTYFLNHHQYLALISDLQKFQIPGMNNNLRFWSTKAADNLPFRQYLASLSDVGDNSTCHTYETIKNKFFRLCPLIQALNEATYIRNSWQRLDSGFLNANSFLMTLANQGNALITDPEKARAAIALTKGKASLELRLLNGIKMFSVVQYVNRTQNIFQKIENYANTKLEEEKLLPSDKKTAKNPRRNTIPEFANTYYAQRQISNLVGYISVKPLLYFPIDEAQINEETFQRYEQLAHCAFEKAKILKPNINHKFLINVTYKSLVPPDKSRITELNRIAQVKTTAVRDDLNLEVYSIVGNIMQRRSDVKNKPFQLMYRFRNQEDTSSYLQQTHFGSCLGSDTNFCKLGDINGMLMDKSYKKVLDFAGLQSQALTQNLAQAKKLSTFKRDQEVYRSHTVIESISLFLVVQDNVPANRPENQALQLIHGLIDNNDEIAHVNLNTAQNYQFLSKYANMTRQQERRLGLGAIKNTPRIFRSAELKRFIEMLADGKVRIDLESYFQESGIYRKPIQQNEIRVFDIQVMNPTKRQKILQSFKRSVFQIVIDYYDEMLGLNKEIEADNANQHDNILMLKQQERDKLVYEKCSQIHRFQKLSVNLLKYHHGKDWIEHQFPQLKTVGDLKETFLYLMPIMLTNFRVLRRRQKTNDAPQIPVLVKSQWNEIMKRIVQACALYLRCYINDEEIQSQDIINYAALQPSVIFNFCLLLGVFPIYVPKHLQSKLQIRNFVKLDRKKHEDIFFAQIKQFLTDNYKALFTASNLLIKKGRNKVPKNFFPSLDILQRFVFNATEEFLFQETHVNNLMKQENKLLRFKKSQIVEDNNSTQNIVAGQLAHHSFTDLQLPPIFDKEAKYNADLEELFNDDQSNNIGNQNQLEQLPEKFLSAPATSSVTSPVTTKMSITEQRESYIARKLSDQNAKSQNLIQQQEAPIANHLQIQIESQIPIVEINNANQQAEIRPVQWNIGSNPNLRRLVQEDMAYAEAVENAQRNQGVQPQPQPVPYWSSNIVQRNVVGDLQQEDVEMNENQGDATSAQISQSKSASIQEAPENNVQNNLNLSSCSETNENARSIVQTQQLCANCLVQRDEKCCVPAIESDSYADEEGAEDEMSEPSSSSKYSSDTEMQQAIFQSAFVENSEIQQESNNEQIGQQNNLSNDPQLAIRESDQSNLQQSFANAKTVHPTLIEIQKVRRPAVGQPSGSDQPKVSLIKPQQRNVSAEVDYVSDVSLVKSQHLRQSSNDKPSEILQRNPQSQTSQPVADSQQMRQSVESYRPRRYSSFMAVLQTLESDLEDLKHKMALKNKIQNSLMGNLRFGKYDSIEAQDADDHSYTELNKELKAHRLELWSLQRKLQETKNSFRLLHVDVQNKPKKKEVKKGTTEEEKKEKKKK